MGCVASAPAGASTHSTRNSQSRRARRRSSAVHRAGAGVAYGEHEVAVRVPELEAGGLSVVVRGVLHADPRGAQRAARPPVQSADREGQRGVLVEDRGAGEGADAHGGVEERGVQLVGGGVEARRQREVGRRLAVARVRRSDAAEGGADARALAGDPVVQGVEIGGGGVGERGASRRGGRGVGGAEASRRVASPGAVGLRGAHLEGAPAVDLRADEDLEGVGDAVVEEQRLLEEHVAQREVRGGGVQLPGGRERAVDPAHAREQHAVEDLVVHQPRVGAEADLPAQTHGVAVVQSVLEQRVVRRPRGQRRQVGHGPRAGGGEGVGGEVHPTTG